jgi:hypothetical protein
VTKGKPIDTPKHPCHTVERIRGYFGRAAADADVPHSPPNAGVLLGAPNAGVLLPPYLNPALLFKTQYDNQNFKPPGSLPPKAGVLLGAPNAGVLLPPKLKPPLLAGWLAVAPNRPPVAAGCEVAAPKPPNAGVLAAGVAAAPKPVDPKGEGLAAAPNAGAVNINKQQQQQENVI